MRFIIRRKHQDAAYENEEPSMTKETMLSVIETHNKMSKTISDLIDTEIPKEYMPEANQLNAAISFLAREIVRDAREMGINVDCTSSQGRIIYL